MTSLSGKKGGKEVFVIEWFNGEIWKPFRAHIYEGQAEDELANCSRENLKTLRLNIYIPAAEQSEGWIKVSELVSAVEAKVAIELRWASRKGAWTTEDEEESTRSTEDLVSALAAYKAALPSPPTSEETANG